MSSELWAVILFVLIAFCVIIFQMYVINDQQKRIDRLTNLMVEYKADARRFRFWLTCCFHGNMPTLPDSMVRAKTEKHFIDAIDMESGA